MRTVNADHAVLGLWGHVRAMCVDVHDGKSLGEVSEAARWQSLWAGSVGGMLPGGVLCTQVCVTV